MKDPIQKYFQIGTIQWMSHPPVSYDLLDSVKTLAVDDFFTAIEITKIADDETRDKVKHMLEQSHMKVCYGAQPRLLGPGLNPNDVDEEGRKKAEETLLEVLMRHSIWVQRELHFWPESGIRRQRKRHTASC